VTVQESDLATAEAALGITLPVDYRQYLMLENGSIEQSDDTYIELWCLEVVAQINTSDAYGLGESLPGLLLIGSDGGGELLGLDLRTAPAQVVLVNAISGSWDEASYQTDSVSAFLAHLRSGGGLTFA
jgi:hypothetical protein